MGGLGMKFLKCKICGKIIAVVNDRQVPTICCGEPMEEMIPNTSDGAVEKHVPVCKVEGNVVTVEVGSVEHPMAPQEQPYHSPHGRRQGRFRL